MSDLIKINIACGDTYLSDWRNFDYMPCSSDVRKANLLDKLPASDNIADVVYSSHFFEHIPRMQVGSFLSECFRIAKTGGRLRLVLPDFEELCSTYLSCRRCKEHEKADFLILEILDQCVRQSPGGELNIFYHKLQASGSENENLVQFIRHRNGHVINENGQGSGGRLWRLLTNPSMLFRKLEFIYIRIIVALLPTAFRQQNVSLASIGERHAWLYDFHSVEKLLKQAGFVDIQRKTATTSNIPDFPFYPLDVYEDEMPRKGAESMYIEAVKP
jgi:predicted SAM-dependent methyltransferase